MQELSTQIANTANALLGELYQVESPAADLQPTRKEFTGDLTLVVFPYLRYSKKSPEDTARELGDLLHDKVALISGYNVVKGFLNLEISDAYWQKSLQAVLENKHYGQAPESGKTLLVEYSSPNTNKPLHLGHVRNNLLGYSVAEILKAAGHRVVKAQIINDRGIHICKSMVAWQQMGQGETPQSSGLKGDHLVGKYYVLFDKTYKKQVAELEAQGHLPAEAQIKAPIMQAARETLLRWEQGDAETMALWQKMNGWVYEGFEITYRRLGVDFDQYYYESKTYVLGKAQIEEGLQKGVFYREDDGSVWVDLSDYNMDNKLLLRKDGTSVYMTQDIGTAIQRFEDFPELHGMIYTVGNEQDHHFKVLFIILQKLGYKWAHNLHHLSYGMVDLPSGKMKSREGTVVDADDLISEMENTAQGISEELGKTEGMSEAQKQALYHQVGMGALKYFILKVDPRKKMLFNPEESVDFQGNTGPFIQYTHARICSLLRKAETATVADYSAYIPLQPEEKEVLKALAQFPEVVQEAAQKMSPSEIAQYTYDLVKRYNVFYQNHPVLNDADAEAVAFRVALSRATAQVIGKAMALLGIAVPERM